MSLPSWQPTGHGQQVLDLRLPPELTGLASVIGKVTPPIHLTRKTLFLRVICFFLPLLNSSILMIVPTLCLFSGDFLASNILFTASLFTPSATMLSCCRPRPQKKTNKY